MSEQITLKPLNPRVTTSDHRSHARSQQLFLLKALKITQDPKELRDMIGVKTVAEVYRTLDKMAMRKEYHESLNRAGISFDYITRGIKNIADNSGKEDIQLRAYQTLLKSVGMDRYEDSGISSTGTWEETLLKKIEEGKHLDSPALPSPGVYEVVVPEIPESEKLNQADEELTTGSIYDTK